MRFLRPAYLKIVGDDVGSVPEDWQFRTILDMVELDDADFNSETFPPGTSGEAGLFRYLGAALKSDDQE